MNFEIKPMRKVGALIAACLALGAVSAPIQAWAEPSGPSVYVSSSVNLDDEATKKAADLIASTTNPTNANGATQPLIALAGTPYHADKVAAWATIVENTHASWTKADTPATLNAGAAGYTLSALFAAGRGVDNVEVKKILDAMVASTNSSGQLVNKDAFNHSLALIGAGRAVGLGYQIPAASAFPSTQAWLDSLTTTLLSMQEAAGNWTFYGSEPDTTGIVLQALAGVKDEVSPAVATAIDTAVVKAKTWADNTALTDATTGGKYWKSSNSAGVYNSTGLLVGGLVLWGYDVAPAVDFLVGRQLANGGWAATIDGTSSNAMAVVQAIQGVSGFGYLTALVGSVDTPTAPVITAQPVSVYLLEGETANFSVTASSNSPVTYQWQQLPAGSTDWADVTGATASMLTVDNVTADHKGTSYRVVVTNFVGSTTSAEASIQLINWYAGACLNNEGVTVVLDYNEWASDSPTGEQYVVRCAILDEGATGLDALRGAGFDPVDFGGYLSTINGIPSGGTLFWGYTFAEPGETEWTVSEDGAGDRFPLPGGVEGFRLMDWNVEWDTVPGVGPRFDLPQIVSQPADVTVDEGADATFFVEATIPSLLAKAAQNGLSYQWQELVDGNWTDIAGANESGLTLTAVAANDNGRVFRVVVSTEFAQVSSDQAKLTVNVEEPIAPETPVTPGVPTSGSEGSLLGIGLLLAAVLGAGGLTLRAARAKQ